MKIEKFKTYGEAIAYMKGYEDKTGYLLEGPQLNPDDEGRWTYDVTVTETAPELMEEVPNWQCPECLQLGCNRECTEERETL